MKCCAAISAMAASSTRVKLWFVRKCPELVFKNDGWISTTGTPVFAAALQALGDSERMINMPSHPHFVSLNILCSSPKASDCR